MQENNIPHECLLTEQSISNSSNNSATSIGAISETLTVSILLLIFISGLKYHLEHRNQTKDYFAFGLELPIDLGTVLISFYISFHFLVSNINWFFALILFQMITMGISMIIRNRINDDYIQADTDLNKGKMIKSLIVEICIILLPSIVFLLINLISQIL